LVFNAHQQAAGLGQGSYESGNKNQDIGFSSIASNLDAGSVVWLTSTTNVDEEDSSIARFVAAGTAEEQYVVGWKEDSTYKLALVDASGAFVGAPEDVSAKAQWGKRADPFRRHVNDDIVWAWFNNPGDTTLHFARIDSGGDATCSNF
jgi:hypothetical protein